MKTTLTSLALISFALTPAMAGDNAMANTSSESDAFASMRRPMSNPTLFDAALPTTKLHAIYLNHRFPSRLNLSNGSTAAFGGKVQLYALQFEYAFNDRLSLVALKDGYADFDPNATFTRKNGFANLGAGMKYAYHLDHEAQEVASVTVAAELPTGDTGIFQGAGDGNLIITTQGLKIMDEWQIAGAVGISAPIDDSFSTMGFLSGHISYEVNRYFIPLFEVNVFEVLDEGDGGSRFTQQVGGAVPRLAPSEGVELFNFGASNSNTYATAALGVQSRLTDNMTFGVAYELPVTEDSENLTSSRLTIDLSYTF